MTYDPKFTQKQMYDQYGSSRNTTTKTVGPKGYSKKNVTKPTTSSGYSGNNPNEDEAVTRGIGAKPPSFGGGQDNNPNKDEYENKSTIDKVKEKAVDLFKSFGAKEPEALIVDGKRVYQGPLFRGFDPTVRVGEFGLDNNPNRDASPAMPYGTVNMFGVNTDNPRLNMFGVERGSFRDPTQLIPPVLPETPVNMDPMTRVLSQAMLPTEVNYTIQDGDTLSEIARDAGTTVEELKELNNIDDIDVIDAGANLKVPVKAGKLTDTQAALRRGLDRDKDNEGVEVAALGSSIMGSGIMSKIFGKPDIEGNVDFNFIGELEGAAINKAYIPKKDGKVIAQSGVTVGTGVDLGSKNDVYFEGLSKDLKDKLRPHFGKKKTAAEKSLTDKPLILTDAEVEELDTFVKEKELKTLTDRWNKDSDVKFEDLPRNKATAVAATFYQHGNQMFGYNYWKQTTGGDWEAARDNLRNFGDKDKIFQRRRDREADYLESGEL